MNQFSKRFREFSNTELLRVLQNQSDYQFEAFEAAKNELDFRNLSDKELSDAKQDLENERLLKKKRAEKTERIERKIKEFGATIFESINPIQKSIPTTEKLKRSIVIVFGVLALSLWYNELGMIRFMFSDNSSWDLSMAEYFLPLIILPTAIVLFWFEKTNGWILLSAFLTYSAVGSLGTIALTWDIEPTGLPALDNLLPQSSPITQIFAFLFYGASVWLLTKKELRELFNVSKRQMSTTICLAAIVTILIIAPFLLF